VAAGVILQRYHQVINGLCTKDAFSFFGAKVTIAKKRTINHKEAADVLWLQKSSLINGFRRAEDKKVQS
jgi:hypothetical protein